MNLSKMYNGYGLIHNGLRESERLIKVSVRRVSPAIGYLKLYINQLVLENIPAFMQLIFCQFKIIEIHHTWGKFLSILQS